MLNKFQGIKEVFADGKVSFNEVKPAVENIGGLLVETVDLVEKIAIVVQDVQKKLARSS